MKNFIQPTDLPGTDSAPGKPAKYQRSAQAVLTESDIKEMAAARALLDELLYNSSPLHDPKHPSHEQVKKAVQELEEKLTRLMCDLPEPAKPDTHNSPAKIEIGGNENEQY